MWRATPRASKSAAQLATLHHTGSTDCIPARAEMSSRQSAGMESGEHRRTFAPALQSPASNASCARTHTAQAGLCTVRLSIHSRSAVAVDFPLFIRAGREESTQTSAA